MTTFATAFPVRKDQPAAYRLRFKKPDGTVLAVDSATALQIGFKNPVTDAISWETAVFSNHPDHASDGTDGWVEFDDTAADYSSELGRWKYFGRVTLPTGGPYGTSTLSYMVTEEGDE